MMWRSVEFTLGLALVCATPDFGEDGPLKVPRAQAISAATNKVQPEYPAMARQLRIQGVVELEVVVAESGVVENVTIVSGNPVLTKASAEAAKKWKFKPFESGGKPTKAQASISFTFTL